MNLNEVKKQRTISINDSYELHVIECKCVSSVVTKQDNEITNSENTNRKTL